LINGIYKSVEIKIPSCNPDYWVDWGWACDNEFSDISPVSEYNGI